MISSIAYMLVGVMAPYEAGFYLSRGNRTTCKIQGFMIQLGQTASMFYNLCLSLYFFLVIMLSWRERLLRKILVGAHVCVVATGLGMSIGALPYIEAQFGVCGILPPLTASQWQVSLFYTVPVSIVLIVLTTVTISICYRVYSQNAKVRKWRTDKRASVTRKVFWQSAWYVSAFYVTLPFVLLSFYVKFKSSRYVWIYIVTAILAPLQGMMNSLVYFQRSKDFRTFWSRVFPCCRKAGESAEWSRSGRRFSFRFSDTFQRENSTDLMEAALDGEDVADEREQDVSRVPINIDEPKDTTEWNTAYLQDERPVSDGASDHDAMQVHNDPLALPQVQPAQDNRSIRRETNMARLREITQPVSSLQTFLGRGRQRTRRRVDDGGMGGVLEYWELHEEDSSSTLATGETSGTDASWRHRTGW